MPERTGCFAKLSVFSLKRGVFKVYFEIPSKFFDSFLVKGEEMFVLVILFILAVTSPATAEGIWTQHEKGWFWYEIVPESKPVKKKPVKKQKKSETKAHKKEVSYSQILKEIRAELDEIRARAVLFPTPENVAAWYRAQLLISQLAGTFTKQALLVPVLFPELDISSQLGGASQLGMEIVSYAKRKEMEDQLRILVQDSALVLVYRSPGCFLCKKEAEEVVKLKHNLGLKTYCLYEGEPPDGVDRVRPLTDELEQFLQVRVFPSLYLFRKGKFHYLGSGFLGQEDIRKRLLLLAQEKGWIKVQDLFLAGKSLKPEDVLELLKTLKEKGYESSF